MKNIHSNLIKLTLVLTLVFGFTSCDEGGDPDPGQTAVVELAGDWVVEVLDNGEHFSDTYVSTYNTSDNTSNEMWVDDNCGGWCVKSKVSVDLTNQTFSGTDLEELYYGVTVTISDAVIVTDGATAPSGTIVDSINFNAVFSDRPNSVFNYSGYKRTGHLEDEL